MDSFVKTAREGKPFSDVFIFDCHGHFGICSGFHIPQTSDSGFVAALDRVGIDLVAVSTFGNITPAGNDVVGQAVTAHPDRFVGYARVNANYPEIMEGELTRCFDELGFKGIKIHPYCDQISLDDPRYRPVWEFSAARNAPVLIHTWNSARYVDPLLKFCHPSLIRGPAEEYPDAVIILGHSGGEYDGILEAIEVAKAFPNVYLDTASSRLYPGVIKMMVEELGAERVLYGSDVPFLSAVTQLGKIIYADIAESDKEMVLGGNAARLFGMHEGLRK